MANLQADCKKNNLEINFERFFVYLSERFTPDNIYIFTGYISRFETDYRAMEEIGYKYIFKEAIINKDENKIKANCDVEIALNGTLDTCEKGLNYAVIISSDGDFSSLVKFWLARKIKVTIISPSSRKECSYLLRKLNTSIIYLDQIITHFQIKRALTEDKTSARPLS